VLPAAVLCYLLLCCATCCCAVLPAAVLCYLLLSVLSLLCILLFSKSLRQTVQHYSLHIAMAVYMYDLLTHKITQ